jgi:hypothetical protein
VKTQFIEATNGRQGNWGKFMLAQFEPEEWARPSSVSEHFISVLRNVGHNSDDILVLDLQTCEGAIFTPRGYARADLNKHQIWVCPLYEAFLTWVYQQDLSDLSQLPELVDLDAPFDMTGYRRPGPGRKGETE